MTNTARIRWTCAIPACSILYSQSVSFKTICFSCNNYHEPRHSNTNFLQDLKRHSAPFLYIHCHISKLRLVNAHYGEYRLHVGCLHPADDNIIHRVSQHYSVGSARNILRSVSAPRSRFISSFFIALFRSLSCTRGRRLQNSRRGRRTHYSARQYDTRQSQWRRI